MNSYENERVKQVMKKVNYTRQINGNVFKCRTDSVIKVHDINDIHINGAVTLAEVYGRHSIAKENAMNYWRSWIASYYVNGMTMRITSHTAQFFSLTAIVFDNFTEDWWLCTMTGRNNYATRIVIG